MRRISAGLRSALRVSAVTAVMGLALCMMNVYAYAAESAQTVSLDEQRSAFKESVEKYESQIDVSGWGWTVENVKEKYKEMIEYYPELNNVVSHGSVEYTRYDDVNIDKIIMEYTDDARQVSAELSAAIAEVKKSVVTKGMSDEEKVLAYHEYLTSTISYDTQCFASGVSESGHSYDMYGALVEHVAVCAGYAEAMLYFLKYEGIPCGIVSSENVDHAWNIVYIDGQWYHVDVTWDDPINDVPGRALHTYFLVSFDTMNNRSVETSGEAGDRSDMKVVCTYGGTYDKASSTKYESGCMWNGVETSMWYKAGYWYALRAKSKYTYELRRYDYDKNSYTVLDSGTSKWYKGDGRVWASQYGKLFMYNGYLYYSTADAIYRINLSGKTMKPELFASMKNGKYDKGVYIYGLGYKKGKAVIGFDKSGVYSSPTEVAYDSCIGHMWDDGKVTCAATYSLVGKMTYTCEKCGGTKTEAIPKLALGRVSVKAVNGTAGVKLSWGKVSGAKGYNIYRKVSNGKYKLLKKVSNGSSCSMTDKSAVSGKRYTYKAVAYNGSSMGMGSESSLYYLSSVKPVLKNRRQGVQITWSRVKGATEYKIYRKTGSTQKFIGSVKSSTLRFIDKKVVSGRKYTYSVRAYNASVVSASANYACRYIKTPTVRLKSVSKGVKVSWTKAAGASSYKIYRKVSSGKYKLVKIVKGSRTFAWTDKSAKKGKTYYYTVKACRGSVAGETSVSRKIKRK